MRCRGLIDALIAGIVSLNPGAMAMSESFTLDDWTFTLDSQCTTVGCNTSGAPITGAFTAVESSTGACFGSTGCSATTAGTYTRPGTGFLELTVPSGAYVPGGQSWKSTLPFSIAAIEIPSVGIVSDTLLSAETQPIVMVESPTCASGNFTANFLAGQWSNNDMSVSSQMATGNFSWTNSSAVIAVSNLFPILSTTAITGSSFSLAGASSCTSGEYSVTGNGDRGGNIWMGAYDSIIYRSGVGHTFYGLPDNSIPDAGSLNGAYAAIRYDSYTSDPSAILPMYVFVNTAGSSATSEKYSDAFGGTIATGGSALTETFNVTGLNSPRQGMITGTFTGANAAQVNCVVGLNLTNTATTKNAILCAGASPADSSLKSPYNLFMVSLKDYPGGPDKTWNNTGTVSTSVASGEGYPFGVAIQTDGKIVVGGQYSTTAGAAILRYNPSGSLDTSFGTAGEVKVVASLVATPPSSPNLTLGGITLQTDGKAIWAGGQSASGGTYLFRFTTAGALDTTFGTSGKSTINPLTGSTFQAVAIQTDGNILGVGDGGSPNKFLVARFTTAGVVDSTFGTSGYVATTVSGTSIAQAIALQTDGKSVVAGYAGGTTEFALARYTTAGALDTAFGTGGTAIHSVIGNQGDAAGGVAIQTDGNIVVCGTSNYTAANDTMTLIRYTTAGILDTTFGTAGVAAASAGADTAGVAVAIQPDGKIVAAGYLQTSDLGVLARFTTSGILDTTFNGGIFTTSGTYQFDAIALESNGSVVVTGPSAASNSLFQVLRFWP